MGKFLQIDVELNHRLQFPVFLDFQYVGLFGNPNGKNHLQKSRRNEILSLFPSFLNQQKIKKSLQEKFQNKLQL